MLPCQQILFNILYIFALIKNVILLGAHQSDGVIGACEQESEVSCRCAVARADSAAAVQGTHFQQFHYCKYF